MAWIKAARRQVGLHRTEYAKEKDRSNVWRDQNAAKFKFQAARAPKSIFQWSNSARHFRLRF